MAVDVVKCPRGHEANRVVRDGIQRSGGRAKQRWRCVFSDGSYHRFLGVMSRTRVTDETCVECENHIAPHQGPVAPVGFEYLVREIAGSLVDVGRGSTYTDAAKRVRARANVGKTSGWREVTIGQTVSEWMADFTPVVAARHAPVRWPEVLVLDSTVFRWADPRNKKVLGLYWIFAAYGYDKDGKNGRLWKLEASPESGGDAWAQFLSTLNGRPESIVCDQDLAIGAGIEKHWGKWAYVNLVHLCEHHLGVNGRKAMTGDGVVTADAVWTLFREALISREGWDAFEIDVRGRPELMLTNRWVEKMATWLRNQTLTRSRIPPVYSNGAVEVPLLNVRNIIAPRAFAYRNRARMNQMLELIRLAHLRVDNVADYATDIRAHLALHNGRPVRTYRNVYDSKADDANNGFCSLWSIAAQTSMRAARLKPTAA